LSRKVEFCSGSSTSSSADERVAVKAACAELVDLVEHQDAVARAHLAQALDDCLPGSEPIYVRR
jgi:hypothetical protein